MEGLGAGSCQGADAPPADAPPAGSGGQLPKWEKVLWKCQPYPDNYVDETFLKGLVRGPPPG